MFYKRTLILSDINNINSGKKGVITFENSNQGIKGQLRLYNFGQKPTNVAIGIASGGDVIKVPITPIDNIVDFDIPQNINLQEKISCGLVDVSEITHPQIIIGGTSNYLNDWADRVEQAFAANNQNIDREEMYSIDAEEIESEITTVLREDQEYSDCSMCTKCKYKQAFFEQNNTIESNPPSQNIQKIEKLLENATPVNVEVNAEKNQEETSDNKQKKEPPTENGQNSQEEKSQNPTQENKNEFYEQIKDQISDLFKNHSREENLESIIPNSKWVKVEYEDTEGHYVMGLIYDNEDLQFISYGLPAQNSSVPPKDLEEYAQWLPVEQTADGEGYWLVYQSAQTGDSVKIK